MFHNRARMSGTYPISPEIFDKHVHHARESVVSSIGATLGFHVEASTISSVSEADGERMKETVDCEAERTISPCMNIQYREPAWFRKLLLFIETFSSLGTVIDNRPRKEFFLFSRFRRVAWESRYVYFSFSLTVYLRAICLLLFVYCSIVHSSCMKSITLISLIAVMKLFGMHIGWYVGRRNFFVILLYQRAQIYLGLMIILIYSLFALVIVRFMNYIYINSARKMDNFFVFCWLRGEILITLVGLIDSLTKRRPSF